MGEKFTCRPWSGGVGGDRGLAMAKVYVSSTIADLAEERRAVLDWLRLARHQAVDSYLPDSDTVRESCLDDVGSCDLYVLILGHRYGFVPPRDNPDALSITHLEFRRAGECGIPRVVLLRTNERDVRLSDLQDPARARLVFAFRDEVAGQVRAAEFSDLKELVTGLSTGIQGVLDKRDEQRSGQMTPSLVLRLAPRPVFLAGRDELLAALDARLAGADDARPRMVALCGLGGAGKTSVAIEYAHRYLPEMGVCWQFHAEDSAVLAAEFAELATQLRAREAADPRDPVASVHAVLARAKAGWLLVFDNVPDQVSVEPFVPPAGRGRVLITTQNQHWPLGQPLEVPVLDSEAAADFLVNRTGDPDQAAARELAVELGGLPLALEQAAAYMQATGTTLVRYLLLFRDRKADLLARGEASGHPADVAATLGLALSRLADDAPAAAGLMRMLAFMASEPVPLDLLLTGETAAVPLSPGVTATVGPLLGDQVAAGDAIMALRRYSLASPAGDGLVLVHRLVQAVTRDQMPVDLATDWRHAAAAVIEAAIPANSDLPDAWPLFAMLLPHIKAVLANDSGGLAQITDGLVRVVNYLSSSCNYAAARELCGKIATTLQESLGPEHPRTLIARTDVADMTGLAGDAETARNLYSELLPVIEQTHSADDPLALSARGSLARWAMDAGDLAGSLKLYADLLPDVERILGPVHPLTLAVRYGFAFSTGLSGNWAGARDLFAELVAAESEVNGPEAEWTLTTRALLAASTGQAGDAAGALEQCLTLQAIRETSLGTDHPTTISLRSNVAHWTGEIGDARRARDLYAAFLPAAERIFGSDHPRTLGFRSDLAFWTGRAGDPATARDQLAGLIAMLEQVRGPRHPNTLTARLRLARFTGEEGDAAGARDQLATLVTGAEQVNGPNHPDTLTARAELARWTGESGDPHTARDMLAALLPIRERVRGPQHPDTIADSQNLTYWANQADTRN